jgi:hypothetical protein
LHKPGQKYDCAQALQTMFCKISITKTPMPASGPDMRNEDCETRPVTRDAITPEIIPNSEGTPQAMATPTLSGNAMQRSTNAAPMLTPLKPFKID